MWRKMLEKAMVRRNFVRKLSNSVPKPQNFKDVPSLKEFLVAGKNLPKLGAIEATNTYLNVQDFNGNGRKVWQR